ncbi:hypothetical protein [Streptomyces narbonensis]
MRDLIYAPDEGRVVEHGTFAQLMDPATSTGAFREAYELQARQFAKPSVPAQATTRVKGTPSEPDALLGEGEAQS